MKMPAVIKLVDAEEKKLYAQVKRARNALSKVDINKVGCLAKYDAAWAEVEKAERMWRAYYIKK
jgi:hypothetical protein